jgi:prepilin-type N-terminal cleavage/methylation domain-containing protein
MERSQFMKADTRRGFTLIELLVVIAIIMVASGVLAGCGSAADELPREAIVGTVKLNGEPLKEGRIQFQGSMPAGAGVIDGDYSISRADGLVPGNYQVLIFGAIAESQPAPAKPGMPGDAPPPKKGAKEPIPAKYNSQSKLTALVTKGGPNKFDFDLTDK